MFNEPTSGYAEGKQIEAQLSQCNKIRKQLPPQFSVQIMITKPQKSCIFMFFRNKF
jgi:hypothetical protein